MCQVCQQIASQEVQFAEELSFGAGDGAGSGAHVADVFDGVMTVSDLLSVDIALEAGREYTISIVSVDADGLEVPGAAPLDLVLEDGSGAVFALDDLGDMSDAEFTFSVETLGVYRFEATDELSLSQRSGTYQITVQQNGSMTEWTYDEIATYLTYTGWADGNNPAGATYSWNVSPGDTISFNVSALTNAGKILARHALDAWSAVSGINFSEVTSGGQIQFDDNQSGAFAQFSTMNGFITSADVNVSTNWLTTNGTDLNGYGYQTYIHEVGHALGLAHSGNYDGAAVFGVSNVYLNDSWQQTVMSYFDQDDNTHVDATFAYVVGPQIADILAIQELYGVAGNLRTGNTTYGDNGSGAGYYSEIMTLDNVSFTIIDDGGTDTLDTSSYNGSQRVFMEAETYSNIFGEVGNLGIARNTILENFEGGSGADVVFGNSANNVINGNGGNDSIYAGSGNDTVTGGTGDDRLVGNAGNDDLTGGAGNDILKGKDGNNTLAGDSGDDKLIGSDTGVDTIYGGSDSDILSGLSGTDTLYGNTGNDFMYGGRDDDVLYGGSGDDVVRGNRNNDTLYGEGGSDSIYGGGNNDTLDGGADRDFLLGENGNDSLDGGTGDDNLTGGAGVDTFIYRDSSYGYDRVLDFENGTDLIDLTDFNFSGMGDINPIASDVTSGVRIDFGSGNVLLLEGITESQLDAGDFLF